MVAVLLALFSNVSAFSQMHNHSQMTSATTETFKVWGNCDMCKARIEKTAKIDGVSKADWDKDTKILTLVYNPSEVKIESILKKIASVGHDTEKFKASEEAYKNLPGCCWYDRESKI